MIEVKTQKQLDVALKKTNDGKDQEVRCVGDGEFRVAGSSTVYAYGSSRVYAYDSSRVSAYGSSTVSAYGSSTVYAYDSSRVSAYGSSRVYAYDSSRVSAYGSSTVYAYGSSRVSASGSSRVSASGSSRVYASGSSRVYASGSSRVSAYDSSTVYAYDSSRVYAYDSSTVYAYDSSRVSAYDSSRVSAYDSSTVYAYDSSRVSAYDSSRVSAKSSRSEITATEAVAVHIHSKPKKLKGGVHIQAPDPKALTAEEAVKRWLSDTTGTGKAKKVTLYKAVNDDLKSERGFLYPIGETVEAPDWNPTPSCGGGLHISPSPHHATRYFMEATRWLECEVKVSDLALCSTHETMPDKAKAKKLKVVREVTFGGAPINA